MRSRQQRKISFMRLSKFITENLDSILIAWVDFARKQLPAAGNMDEVELLDHGREILEEIAVNMAKPECAAEQQAKSEGNSSTASASADVASRIHGHHREKSGFQVEQMVGEYRALRATVLRLWTSASTSIQVEDVEDITRFNEAIDQALAEALKVFASAVDRSRDLFLAIIGHDMRGPLSVIAACAEVDRVTRPDDTNSALVIGRSVAQMRSMLDDLMEYTRHQLGSAVELKRSTVHLGQFARDTLDEINALGKHSRLVLETHGDLQGEWDVKRLHQALSNLIFNALKYGQPKSLIHVILDGTVEDEVTLAIENQGKPIPPHMLATLFDALVRAGGEESGIESRVAGANLGLGLYVVRQIASAHGGTVAVSSDEFSTRFELKLPRFSVR